MAKAPKKESQDRVTLILVALGELSPLTRGRLLQRGDTIELPAGEAQAAVDSGRWAYLVPPKPTEGGASGAD
jgi:hypothetical protein